MDITRYIHRKTYNLLVVSLPSRITEIRDLFGSLMKGPMNRLQGAGLLYETDPTSVSAYGVLQCNSRIKSMPGGSKANGRLFPDIKVLGKMARAMDYLLVQSMFSFNTQLKDLEAEGPKWLQADQNFRTILHETAALVDSPGFIGHPKMERLTEMCLEHFAKTEGEVDEYGDKKETRVMVFCNFRSVVDEIVKVLNRHAPAIKAVEFVGQGKSNGKVGKSQKQQIEVRHFAPASRSRFLTHVVATDNSQVQEGSLQRPRRYFDRRRRSRYRRNRSHHLLRSQQVANPNGQPLVSSLNILRTDVSVAVAPTSRSNGSSARWRNYRSDDRRKGGEELG